MHIGEVIRRRREEQELTGFQLAVKAGMTPSAVSQIETGKRTPNSASVVKLAGALGCEVGDLYPKAQPQLPDVPLISRPEIQEWLRSHGHMTDEEFLSYAGDLDLEIDEDGFPAGLQRAIEELRQTCDTLEAKIREREAQDTLFPRPEGKFGEEAIRELFKQNSSAWKLRANLRYEYLTRELALMNYGRRLHAAGITADHLMYARHSEYERRRWLEAAFAEAGAA